MTPELLASGLVRYVVFLFSTTCHEAAHAYVAKLGGDPTAAEGGQVSLNPLPHIKREPFGMVVLPLLSLLMSGAMVGWASAPYNPQWQRQYPRRAALMAAAGPAMNFLLVIISGVLLRAGLMSGFLNRGGDAMDGVTNILFTFFQLNLLLGIFNLLPFPPFDGFGVLGLLTGHSEAMETFRLRMRQYSFIGLVLGWQAINYVYPPAMNFAVGLMLPAHQG